MADEQKKDTKKLKWVVAVVAAIILAAGAVSYISSSGSKFREAEAVTESAEPVENSSTVGGILTLDGALTEAAIFWEGSDQGKEEFPVDLLGTGVLSLVTLTNDSNGGVKVAIASGGKEDYSFTVEADRVIVYAVHMREAGKNELLFVSSQKNKDPRFFIIGTTGRSVIGLLSDGAGSLRGAPLKF